MAFPLDATLGIGGLPQSGTGHVSLLTGRNAAQLFGRHFGPWPPVRLRSLLQEENLLQRASNQGLRVAFANAYPDGFPGSVGSRRLAGPTLAAMSAGLLTRRAEALVRGEAVATDILNDRWRTRLGLGRAPRISADEAGANLARIANRHDLTLYAHYATDLAGHRGGADGAVASLERVDGFLAGVLGELRADAVLLVASDHGNIEDLTAEHTRNPALGILAGPDLEAVRSLRTGAADITDLPAIVQAWLGRKLGDGERAGNVVEP